jgi:hypothetical protein
MIKKLLYSKSKTNFDFDFVN